VWRSGINDELVLGAGLLESAAEALRLLDRNALVGSAHQREDRGV